MHSTTSNLVILKILQEPDPIRPTQQSYRILGSWALRKIRIKFGTNIAKAYAAWQILAYPRGRQGRAQMNGVGVRAQDSFGHSRSRSSWF